MGYLRLKRGPIKLVLGNESGFSLIQALIIGAILAVLMTTASSFLFQRKKNGMNMDTRNAYNQIQSAAQSSIGSVGAISQTEQLQFATIAGSVSSSTGATTSTTTSPPATATITCPTGCWVGTNPMSGATDCITSDSACSGGLCPVGCSWVPSTGPVSGGLPTL